MKKLFLLLSLLLPLALSARVVLPTFYSDNMILQQNSQVTVTGGATANSNVVVTPSWLSSPV